MQAKRPIIFQPWKVKKILEWDFEKQGNMETRRIINPQPLPWAERFELGPFQTDGAIYGRDCDWLQMTNDEKTMRGLCRNRYGNAGDLLWVRERFLITHPDTRETNDPWAMGEPVEYVGRLPHEKPTALLEGWWDLHYYADEIIGDGWKWRPSIFMPEWASRLTLNMVSTRIERLQAITIAGSRAEGVEDDEWIEWREDAQTIGLPDGTHIENLRDHFGNVWDSINGKKKGFSWDDNPYVQVIEFNKGA